MGISSGELTRTFRFEASRRSRSSTPRNGPRGGSEARCIRRGGSCRHSMSVKRARSSGAASSSAGPWFGTLIAMPGTAAFPARTSATGSRRVTSASGASRDAYEPAARMSGHENAICMSSFQYDEDSLPQARGAPDVTKPHLNPISNYIIGINSFQAGGHRADPASLPEHRAFSWRNPLPGHLFQAARPPLGIGNPSTISTTGSRQSASRQCSGCGPCRKSSANFVTGQQVTGVLTVTDRSALDGVSRPPSKSGNAPP